MCFTFPSSSSPLLFCAFPASILVWKRSRAPSPPGGPVPPRAQCRSVTCWQQTPWQRRMKLEAGFLFPNSLRCCPSGKPWLLWFPTLQLAPSSMCFQSALWKAKTPALWTQILGGSWQRCFSWTGKIFLKLQVDMIHSFSTEASGTLPHYLSLLSPLPTASLALPFPLLRFNSRSGSRSAVSDVSAWALCPGSISMSSRSQQSRLASERCLLFTSQCHFPSSAHPAGWVTASLDCASFYFCLMQLSEVSPGVWSWVREWQWGLNLMYN